MSGSDISSYKDLFLSTTMEHIVALRVETNKLSNTNKKEVLDEIFRRVHSLKGSSTVMGLSEITEICQRVIEIVKSPSESALLEEHKISLFKNIDEIEANLSIFRNKPIGTH